MAVSVEVPLGLQKLMATEHVRIKQKHTILANKYEMLDDEEQFLFNAREESSTLDVLLGGTSRHFCINLYDTNDHGVISFQRPYALGVSKLKVQVTGSPVAVVRQQPTFLKPVFNVNDVHDRPVLRVKGPVAYKCECDFEVLTLEKQRIGFIRKKWRGLGRELFTNTDHFEVSFPLDLDVKYKAALLGTALLIDFLYYEKN